MHSIKGIIKKNSVYFICLSLFLLAAAYICVFYTKAEGFYLLNPFHNNAATSFFIYFTWLGDGLFCVLTGIALFFFNRRYLSVLVISSYLLSGLITQVLKYFIIEARPAVYLKDSTYKYFIDTVTLHNFHAFPSGHTASAFALATVLAVALDNRPLSVLFLLTAILVGYSRIYLGQHFLIDVLFGSLIGVISAIACLFVTRKETGFFKGKFNYFSSNVTDISNSQQ
jgi:membrane-associated phospholipid phosphatase